jgi:hypothetical protein
VKDGALNLFGLPIVHGGPAQDPLGGGQETSGPGGLRSISGASYEARPRMSGASKRSSTLSPV